VPAAAVKPKIIKIVNDIIKNNIIINKLVE
jgi:hypothetical protein